MRSTTHPAFVWVCASKCNGIDRLGTNIPTDLASRTGIIHFVPYPLLTSMARRPLQVSKNVAMYVEMLSPHDLCFYKIGGIWRFVETKQRNLREGCRGQCWFEFHAGLGCLVVYNIFDVKDLRNDPANVSYAQWHTADERWPQKNIATH